MNSDSFIRYYFGGYLFIAIIIKSLKLYLKKKQPNSYSKGMPSSRAATISYLTTITFLRHSINDVTQAIILLVCAILFAMKLIFREHTVKQMGVGAIIGIVIAYVVASL